MNIEPKELHRITRVIQSRLRRRKIYLQSAEIRKALLEVLSVDDETSLSDKVNLTVLKFLQNPPDDPLKNPELLETVEKTSYEQHLYNANLDYSRKIFDSHLGKKSTKAQWDNIVFICHDLKFITTPGLIPEHHLKTIAKIIKIKKCLATSERIRAYMDLLRQIQSEDSIILGVTVWHNASKLYKEFKGLDAKTSTIYSWFNRSGFSYRSSQRYTPEQSLEVYLRAMF